MNFNGPLDQKVNFGGETVPLGKAIAIMQKEGHQQKLIDRWAQGAVLAIEIKSRRSMNRERTKGPER